MKKGELEIKSSNATNCSAPFRKAEFMIYYDGREMSKTQELADILLNKGMLPRYRADGTPDEKGRTFRFEYEDEILEAKKRDEVFPALEKCPKIQEYFLNRLKSGDTESVYYSSNDDEFESEDDFLKSLEEDDNLSEAEETENGWDNI